MLRLDVFSWDILKYVILVTPKAKEISVLLINLIVNK